MRRRTVTTMVLLCLLGPWVTAAADDSGSKVAGAFGHSTRSPRFTLTTAIEREARRIPLRRVRAKPAGGSLRQDAAARKNWIARHPALFGTIAGAGAGALAAAAMENEWFCSGSDEDCIFYGSGRLFVGAGLGAGAGALIGWLAGK
jgi:hypothetical protein